MHRTVTLKQSLVYSKQVGFDYFRQKRVSQSIFVAAFIYQDHISISPLHCIESTFIKDYENTYAYVKKHFENDWLIYPCWAH